jgi:hypothetical protein
VASRFVVCTFVPRPIESDPGALRVPFYHSNDDFDEVLFYHAGDFFSRDNIKRGMVTFHPPASPTVPIPRPLRRAGPRQDLHRRGGGDARHPDALAVGPICEGVEHPRYVTSWQRPETSANKEFDMKLATLNNGKRDGALVVVSRDLARAVHVTTIAPPCSRPSTSGEKWRRN